MTTRAESPRQTRDRTTTVFGWGRSTKTSIEVPPWRHNQEHHRGKAANARRNARPRPRRRRSTAGAHAMVEIPSATRKGEIKQGNAEVSESADADRAALAVAEAAIVATGAVIARAEGTGTRAVQAAKVIHQAALAALPVRSLPRRRVGVRKAAKMITMRKRMFTLAVMICIIAINRLRWSTAAKTWMASSHRT